jgi:methyltransferase (TIGR00027 family)
MDKPAAQTAIGPMIVCAVDQFDENPLIRDEFAGRIVPAGARVFVALARWRPIQRAIERLAEKWVPGIWAGMLCRKRYVDDKVLDAVNNGVSTVVILGAGLDTRAYRLPIPDVRVYEVDQPINLDLKRARLTALFGAVPAHVTQVPIDFQTEDLASALAAAGYQSDRPTVFVWEGVTPYLTETAIDTTCRFLSTAVTGSRLVFTYFRQDFVAGKEFYGAEAAYRDYVVKRGLWRFGLAPEAVGEFLARYGWRVTDHVGPKEYAERYVEPHGRVQPVSEIERVVYAEKID